MRSLLFSLSCAAFASLLLAGCVGSQPVAQPDSRLAELNASVQVLQAKCDGLSAEKGAAESSLAAAAKARGECEQTLRNSVPADRLAGINSKLADAEKTLEGALPSNNAKIASGKHKELSNLGCLYYIGVGGFFQNTNVTIPLGCVLLISGYINASNTYLAEGIATGAAAEKALALVKEARTQ